VTVSAIHGAAALSFGAFFIGLILLTARAEPPTLAWLSWPFLYSLMMYGAVASAFHVVRANQAAHRQAIAIREAQNLLIASELSALRSKLNPHFLFNTLHSIIALTRKDPGAAETALFHFSDMLRYVLDTEKSGADRVTLDDELRFVRDYLDLEALRLGERLVVEWDIDPAADGHSLPALTLQPLVENSIKHAFNPRSRPGKLLIRTRLDGEAQRLALTVRDDGPGADPARVRTSNGLGIRTVERRLLLDYGQDAQFDIQTNPGAGFDVSLSIPVQILETEPA
jgi:LytS/YehU family sensor histidine kinase